MKTILVSSCGVIAAAIIGATMFIGHCNSMAENLYDLQCAANGELVYDDLTASQAATEFEDAYTDLVMNHGDMVVREVLAQLAGMQQEAEELAELERSARTEAKRRIGIKEKDPFSEYNKRIKTEIKPILYKHE